MSKPNKRFSELLPVAKVLQSLLSNSKSKLSDPYLRWRLWRFWDKVVGPTLGASSEPVGYEKGRLFIWVSSSARMQEMRFFEGDLKIKINNYMGFEWVKNIRFTLDRKGVPQDPNERENLKNTLAKQDE